MNRTIDGFKVHITNDELLQKKLGIKYLLLDMLPVEVVLIALAMVMLYMAAVVHNEGTNEVLVYEALGVAVLIGAHLARILYNASKDLKDTNSIFSDLRNDKQLNFKRYVTGKHQDEYFVGLSNTSGKSMKYYVELDDNTKDIKLDLKTKVMSMSKETYRKIEMQDWL